METAEERLENNITAREENAGDEPLLTIFDKIFWFRAGLGGVTGVLAQLVFGSDYYNGVVLGLLVYLVSYYIARFAYAKKLAKEQLAKIYTSGLGTFVALYIFCWLLLFTLGVHSLQFVLVSPSPT